MAEHPVSMTEFPNVTRVRMTQDTEAAPPLASQVTGQLRRSIASWEIGHPGEHRHREASVRREPPTLRNLESSADATPPRCYAVLLCQRGARDMVRKFEFRMRLQFRRSVKGPGKTAEGLLVDAKSNLSPALRSAARQVDARWKRPNLQS